MTSVAAVIVDVVGSRRLTDRAHAQDAVREAFAVADAVVPALTPLWATFADEFQAVYASPEHACAATGIARLALADAYDIRAGIGFGASVEVEPGATGPVLDGDAWWSARAAIDEAHTRGRRVGTTRTWLVSRMHAHRAAALNNALLLRDQIIGTMNAREKRVTLGLIAGQTQTQIAESEGVTQSAVSQSARRSGALVLEQTTALWAAS